MVLPPRALRPLLFRRLSRRGAAALSASCADQIRLGDLSPTLEDMLEPPLRRTSGEDVNVPVATPPDDLLGTDFVDRRHVERHGLAGRPLPVLDVLGHHHV